MLKAKMSEAFVLATIKSRPPALTTDDDVRLLKNAGASPAIIAAMKDLASGH